jgi:hypothetical protein
MGQKTSTRDLSVNEQWLVRAMSEHQFGRIEGLRIEDGQPVPEPYTRIVRIARFGAGPTPIAAGVGDFELKQAVRDLLGEFERIGNGMIHRLEFRHGLPFQVEIENGADDKPLEHTACGFRNANQAA